jgi:glycosyltransferase involved in cell wall biosynthesis
MKNKRIAICHQTLLNANAIGHDILAMCDLLRPIGFEPTIFCEYSDVDTGYRSLQPDLDVEEINDYEAVIFHHSIFWEKGLALLNAYNGPAVLKYHNITTPHFFAPYSGHYEDLCERGIALTKHLIGLNANHFWLADSEFNRADLIAAGEQPDRITVVPPFNKIDALLNQPNTADYYSDEPYYALFIGRLAPNKGHATLLRILHSYRMHIANNLVIRFIGNGDIWLASYRAELETLIEDLGLGSCVEFIDSVSQDDLITLLRTSHVYICTSYHEGFCIPLIEAQASGLPIVVMDSTAVRETAGEGQLVGPEPVADADFRFYASLLSEVLTNADLRQTVVRKGYQNVTSRFTQELIENKFIETLMPVIRRSV